MGVVLTVLAASFFALLGTPMASADTCPNATFRVGPSASLPDCRAYEQVSPVFKGGFAFVYQYSVAGGERVDGGSLGAGSGGNPPPGPTTTNYDVLRTASGWVTSPLDAPLSQFAYAVPYSFPGLLSDAGASLQLIRPVSDSIYASDLYLRRPDGSLSEVGPTLPRSALPPAPTGPSEAGDHHYGGELLGATPDFSHAVFQLFAHEAAGLPPGVTTTDLWPGDTTVQSNQPEGERRVSLYQYVGTANSEPALVGVKNHWSLHGSPHINEGAELISQCGTFLGGAHSAPVQGNKHNAISSDGSDVFFTAKGADEDEFIICGGSQPPVGELFARLDGERTVAVSEPSPQTGCAMPACLANTGPGHEANFRDANFEGASTDGSKVLFTSTQQLLDAATQDPSTEASATRGQAGCQSINGENGCNLYLYDFAKPAGERLIDLSAGETPGEEPRVQGVAAVSEDASHVYFLGKGVLTGSRQNEYGATAQAGKENLYVADTTTGHTTFIATLSEEDHEQWRPNASSPMNVTSDGRFLVFTSQAALTPDDTLTASQVFRYDAQTRQLLRVSIGQEGFNDNGNTNVDPAGIARVGFGEPTTANENLHPAVSDDGSTVVFASVDRLTPQAPDSLCLFEEAGVCFEYATHKIYEYREGHVYLISASSPAFAPGSVSSSGRDIFFETPQSLVPQDTDTQSDVYDARIDGGFPAPVEPASCSGEACQGAPSAAPALGSPGSATLTGSGNLAPPVAEPKKATPKKVTKCPKGKKRSHGKCLKAKSKKKARTSDGRRRK